MRISTLLSFLCLLFSAGRVVGWSADSPIAAPGVLAARQDDTSSITFTSQTEPTTSTGSSAATSSSESTAALSATFGTTGSKTTSKSTKTTSIVPTSIDPRLPPGGIEMVTPAPIAEATYYKIGDYVTFAWNYTSLSVTPSAIDVMASCQFNNHLYTIALNQSVEPTGAVTWDTRNFQKTASITLLTETYTLVVYDAAESISAVPKAGYLGTSDQFTFGMYKPQPAVALNDFKCVSCKNNGASSSNERQALGLALTMATITLLSFTWFTGGLRAL